MFFFLRKESLKNVLDRFNCRIIYSKCLGATFENIENELYLGHRTDTRLYNNFIIEISFLAIKNGLISI